jgi:dihydroneopterin aldolase
MFKVFVRGIEAQAEIGVYPHERERRQPLIIDVELTVEGLPTSDLSNTVNYERVINLVDTVLNIGHIDLIEEFGLTLARLCLIEPLVKAAEVRVEKPSALLRARAAGVLICLQC